MGADFSCFTDEEDECRKFNTRIRNALVKLFQQVEPVFEDAELQLFFAETEIACRQIFTSYAATLKSYNQPSSKSTSSSSSSKKKNKSKNNNSEKQNHNNHRS